MYRIPLPHLLRLALGAVWLAAVQPATASAQIYRCGHTYSQTPCPHGHAVTVPAPSPGSGAAFLCRRGAATFWSPRDCPSQGAVVLRRHSVPSHWSWERQQAYAEREWQRAERRTAVQAPPAHHAETSASAQRAPARAECVQAEQRLRQLDAMGRQGGSAQLMERLRKERRELRDWQFRSGC